MALRVINTVDNYHKYFLVSHFPFENHAAKRLQKKKNAYFSFYLFSNWSEEKAALMCWQNDIFYTPGQASVN